MTRCAQDISMDTQWDEVPIATADQVPAHYVQVTENGYGMLLAWIAGPSRCARVAVGLHNYSTVVTTTHLPGGESTVSTRPRSDEDQQDIDHAIAGFLTRFSIPSPPSGYQWYVQGVPGDSSADLVRAIGTTADTGSDATFKHVAEKYERYLTEQ